MPLRFTTMPSPIGQLTLVASDTGLTAILWADTDPDDVHLRGAIEDRDDPILTAVARELTAYFDGTLTTFTVPLDFRGTDFQKSVWAALLTIPFGETRSYGDVARQIGRPSACRAVGAANGRNPIPIIAPCHRVIGSNGALTGFGGGLDVKALLLKIEGYVPQSGEQIRLI